MEAQKEGKVGGPGRVREGQAVLLTLLTVQRNGEIKRKQWKEKKEMEKGRARGHSGIWSAIDYSLYPLWNTVSA